MRANSGRVMMVWVMLLGSSLFVGACGFLDDDIGLSDEAFEASFGTGERSLRPRHISARGCGIGGSYASHSHYGHHRGTRGALVTHRHAGPTVIEMEASHISASHISASRAADAASGAKRGARRYEPGQEDEQEPDAPIYAAGELETWGDYLEAELERAQ